jgi:hypothetical protein
MPNKSDQIIHALEERAELDPHNAHLLREAAERIRHLEHVSTELCRMNDALLMADTTHKDRLRMDTALQRARESIRAAFAKRTHETS